MLSRSDTTTRGLLPQRDAAGAAPSPAAPPRLGGNSNRRGRSAQRNGVWPAPPQLRATPGSTLSLSAARSQYWAQQRASSSEAALPQLRLPLRQDRDPGRVILVEGTGLRLLGHVLRRCPPPHLRARPPALALAARQLDGLTVVVGASLGAGLRRCPPPGLRTQPPALALAAMRLDGLPVVVRASLGAGLAPDVEIHRRVARVDGGHVRHGWGVGGWRWRPIPSEGRAAE
eukprot:CAMPEP_0175493210 /NCGR_PEP_ID=MMETSP0096-20121207/2654_1 /TAXON_ID=311494 /ORGANISM="Alexandrium monilatum, Strain CCMP3105" /LENGTH=229 /DNA_ID=CAMNT_0016795145 /DNA_START=114 /DNA_END=801 /DNA_ORIENTATION=+